MLEVGQFKSLKAEGELPHKHGVYCFTDHQSKVIYANGTNDVSLGVKRHQEKLERRGHVNKKFLESYMCGELTCTYFPLQNWDEVDSVLEGLTKDSGYTVERL